jgi:hypothetical protein
VNAAVAIAAVSGVKRLPDRGLKVGQRIGRVVFGLVIEVRRTSQSGDVEEHLEGIFGLEGGDSVGFYRRPCALKARNFFR